MHHLTQCPLPTNLLAAVDAWLMGEVFGVYAYIDSTVEMTTIELIQQTSKEVDAYRTTFLAYAHWKDAEEHQLNTIKGSKANIKLEELASKVKKEAKVERSDRKQKSEKKKQRKNKRKNNINEPKVAKQEESGPIKKSKPIKKQK